MNLDDKHAYRVGSHSESWSDLPADDDTLDKFIASARKRIEPWLSAVFQAEHLNLLIGSGFTTAVGYMAGANATGMGKVVFGSEFDKQIDDFAANEAARMGRGAANIEDQFRAALSVYEGLKVIDTAKATILKSAMDVQLRDFLESLLKTEAGLISGDPAKRVIAEGTVQSFLLSFASRAASRERLHVFTTNYDRLIEHGCDLAGLRIIDRFVGALTPVFRSARVEVDVHYNPPGIRGEPRFMEGVMGDGAGTEGYLLLLWGDVQEPSLRALAAERNRLVLKAIEARLPAGPRQPEHTAGLIQTVIQGSCMQWLVEPEGELAAFMTKRTHMLLSVLYPDHVFG